MNADDDVRAPFLELISNVTHAAFVKKITRLGPYLIDHPIQILHPVLLIFERPVINADELISDVMRFFNAFNDLNNRRITLPKFIQPVRDRLRRRPMSATGVG